MLQQAAKTSSMLDLGEEGVDRQLQNSKEETKPEPGKVISKKGVVVLGQEEVYRFRSRAPSTSVHCNGEGSLWLSRIPAPMKDGKIVEMLARSASYWVLQEPARCWVRDCTGLACSAGGHPSRKHLLQHYLLGEEDSLTSLIKEELISVDEGNDGSMGDTGTASSQADVTSDDDPRSFAEEYSLAPLNTRKKYSVQSFDQQVENYFKRL
ncbi:5' exonuclease Apollo [Grus japonensis]|uniref:5' exonuclease Apollo n=1 Tax=Grus japonensis TaxID=30415 RepID=A0ABC9WBM0_GRUJA